MEKKNFMWYMAVMMALVLSASLVACGDDDDDKKKSDDVAIPSNDASQGDEPTTPGTPSYLDASINWGANMQTIKGYMRGYELLNEGDDYLIYGGNGISSLYFYDFENNKLVTSEVDLNMEVVSFAGVQNKLATAGYTLVEKRDTAAYYISADQATFTAVYESQYYSLIEVINIDYEWMMSEPEPEPEPEQVYWREPYLNWGATKTAVKNYMSSYEMVGETDNIVAYYGKDTEYAYWYFFESAKLVESEVDIAQEDVTYSYLKNKLVGDGYESLGTKPDSVAHYYSQAKGTYVFLVTSKYYGDYELQYCDYAWLASSRAYGRNADQMLNYADFKKEKQLAPKMYQSMVAKAKLNLKKQDMLNVIKK